jgi:hypothetical protein
MRGRGTGNVVVQNWEQVAWGNRREGTDLEEEEGEGYGPMVATGKSGPGLGPRAVSTVVMWNPAM